MFEWILEIYDYLIIGISTIGFIFITLYKITKNSKYRKIFENLLILKGLVKNNMYTAEGFLNFSGSDKKEWVKIKVNQYCIEHGIKYDELEVDNSIEEYIELSKTVNKREQEKEKLV